MASMDYQKVNEVGSILSRMCKDLASQSNLREIYDLILKWMYLRLWGGNTSVSSIFEIMPQLLAILEKKSVVIKDHEMELILSIIR